MLTEAEIDNIRTTFERYGRRPVPGPTVWGDIIDGPLAGLRVRLRPAESANPKQIWGWAAHTSKGVLISHYIQRGIPGKWRFDGLFDSGAKTAGAVRSLYGPPVMRDNSR